MPRKRRVLSQEILIAYHEAGHTVMALGRGMNGCSWRA